MPRLTQSTRHPCPLRASWLLPLLMLAACGQGQDAAVTGESGDRGNSTSDKAIAVGPIRSAALAPAVSKPASANSTATSAASRAADPVLATALAAPILAADKNTAGTAKPAAPSVPSLADSLRPNAPTGGVVALDERPWCLDGDRDGIGLNAQQRLCAPEGSRATLGIVPAGDVGNPALREVTVMFPGLPEPRRILAEQIDGQWVYQSDMVVHPGTMPTDCPAGTACGGSIISAGLWPKGVIPYKIETGHPLRQLIINAAQRISEQTNLRIIERTNEDDYVSIRFKADTCRSKLGKLGWFEDLVENQTMEIGASCSKGSIMHEFLHTAGLVHEHTRSDRDDFVEIVWQNIKAAKKHNFRKNPVSLQIGPSTIPYAIDIGPYDFDSIMHYGPTFFASSPGLTTIRRRDGRPFSANRSNLSMGDIAAVNTLYPKPAPDIVQSYNPDPASTYLLATRAAHDRMIDIAATSPVAGTNIRLRDYDNSTAQVFRFRKTTGGYHEIHAGLDDSLTIDVTGGRTATGTNIQLWGSNGTASQRFRIVPVDAIHFEFESALDPTMVLEIYDYSAASGANIVLARRTGLPTQQFKLVRMQVPKASDRVYALETRLGDGLFVAPAGGSTARGTHVSLGRWNDDGRQIVRFRRYIALSPLGNSLYNGWLWIEMARTSSRLIEAESGGAVKGANVRLQTRNYAINQLWRPSKQGAAYFEFANARGHVLDVDGGLGVEGRNLQLWPRNHSSAQKFKILETAY
ncbi:MAG: RICIN domain-containing protein [Burkholderiaceae bacterium]